jgi:hypothetical protein
MPGFPSQRSTQFPCVRDTPSRAVFFSISAGCPITMLSLDRVFDRKVLAAIDIMNIYMHSSVFVSRVDEVRQGCLFFSSGEREFDFSINSPRRRRPLTKDFG